MLAFLRSSIRFIGNVTRRSVAGIVWWLLDVADLYSKLIAPRLPAEWVISLQPYTEYLGVATPFVVAVIVIWAILFTYYEVDKQINRDPKVSAKLKEFYVSGERFEHLKISNDAEFEAFKVAVTHWYRSAETWIQENMSQAACSLFRDTSGILPITHGHDYNREHMGFINTVQKWRGNLQRLIESGEWDKDG